MVFPVAAGAAHFHIIVITAPGSAGVIGRKTGEPYIPVIGGCTGFAGDSHIPVEIARSPRTGGYDVHHCIRQQVGGGFLNDLPGVRSGIVQQHIAAGVGNSAVKLGGHVIAHIGNGGVGSGQFIGGDTVGQASQRQRLVYIRIEFIFPVGIRNPYAVCQRGKSEIQQIVIAQLRGDDGFGLYCHNIQ